MVQNHPWSEERVQINAFMTATAWHLKRWMEKFIENILHFICRSFFSKNPNTLAFLRND
jgi:IS5 family transposase